MHWGWPPDRVKVCAEAIPQSWPTAIGAKFSQRTGAYQVSQQAYCGVRTIAVADHGNEVVRDARRR